MRFRLSGDLDEKDMRARCEALSPRQKAVLRGLAEHKSAKQIAIDLDIRENTVWGYATDARMKMGIGFSREAARIFVEYERELAPRTSLGDRVLWVATGNGLGSEVVDGLSSPPEPDGADEVCGDAVTDPNAVSDATSFTEPVVHHHPSQGENMIAADGGRQVGRGASLGDHRSGIHLWLSRMGPDRWFMSVVTLMLFIIAAFGLGSVGLLGVFEVLHQIGNASR